MGMYTELHYNARMMEGLPPEIVAVLRFMTAQEKEDVPPPTPAHPLFETERWRWMFWGDSYYFAVEPHSTFEYDDISSQYYLCVRCNLKNYGDEIQHFIDWIAPYLEDRSGELLGFFRYESDDVPTLIFAPKTLVTPTITDAQIRPDLSKAVPHDP